MTVIPVVLNDLERRLDLVGVSQLVIAAGLIAFMIFRRQGIMGTRELSLSGIAERLRRPRPPKPTNTPTDSSTPTHQ
jgi:branched-chain amino acid transport system permease protein